MIADELRTLIDRCEQQIAAARQLLELMDSDPTPPAGIDRPVVDDQDDDDQDDDTGPELVHVCQDCGREFKLMGWLNRHREKEHPAPAPAATDPTPARAGRGPVFECEEPGCEYSCNEASKMIRHTLAAHGRRPHPTERTPQAVTA